MFDVLDAGKYLLAPLFHVVARFDADGDGVVPGPTTCSSAATNSFVNRPWEASTVPIISHSFPLRSPFVLEFSVGDCNLLAAVAEPAGKLLDKIYGAMPATCATDCDC